VNPSEVRRPLPPPGRMARVMSAIASACKWLVVSLVFSVLIEWIGMIFWWPEQGLEHSRTMLAQELAYLGAHFHHSWLVREPIQFAAALSETVSYYAFEWTRLLEFCQWMSPSPEPHERGVRPLLHAVYTPTAEFVLAGVQITQVFTVRLAILLLATPVFALFALVALVDGLVRRDLRRWGGGRESSFIYHYAKTATLPLITTAWVVYLALPFSVHPSWIILPFALAFAGAIALTASTFKKYL
jgi:integrating conjugative element membrane protein (TIGR03747 family)